MSVALFYKDFFLHLSFLWRRKCRYDSRYRKQFARNKYLDRRFHYCFLALLNNCSSIRLHSYHRLIYLNSMTNHDEHEKGLLWVKARYKAS